MSNDNDFANKAINKFLFNKHASLSISLPSIKADDSKPKEESNNKKIEQEKESKAESAYEDYLENWKQGDPIPFLPPGKEFILCRVNLNPMTADKEAGYHDIPELTKKPYNKSSPEEQLIEFKNLGPKLSASLTSILGRVAKSRGLWIDDKNKLRCPPGSPAANQFTDITGSNCLIPSPQTAAGSARRAARRAVNSADILSSPLGGRTDTSSAGTEQRVQAYTTDDFAMVNAAMGVGGRIGMPGRVKGPVWSREKARRDAPKNAKPDAFTKSWHLGAKEQRERGLTATTQADVLHRRFMGQGAPVGVTRASRRTVRAMDRQIASPSNYLLPSGNPVGDILNRANFVRAMKEILPNVNPAEIEKAFDEAIPTGLTLRQRMEAQLAVRTMFEGIIFNAIQNPEHFKWITQLNTGPIDGNPSVAFEIKLAQFAPSPVSGGRLAGTAVTNLARSPKSMVGETGGMHVQMNFSPLGTYLYAKGAGTSRFTDGSGEFDSIEGKALYLGTHESGHMVDFAEKLKALGLNPNTLSRFGTTSTLVSTPGGPARQPNFYSKGWDIDWSMVRNPAGNASVQEMIDAAGTLQTTAYTGGRFGGRRIDLQDSLNKFHLGFSDAFTNNINTTEAEHELMAQFAGGNYAASSPIEARAEFYVTRMLFGESTKFPSTVYPGSGPIKVADKNLVEKFAETEALRRAIQEVDSGLITAAAQPARELVLRGEVLNELRNAGRDTFGIPAGGWNVSGLMSTAGRNGRVSLHARRVQDLVAATEIQTQRKRRGTNIPTGVSGKMSTPQIEKPSRPREPDNGPYTGRFLEVFNGVKDFEEFRDRYRKQDIIYFDYETTGFGADGNMPVQIGAVRMRGGQVIERFNVFVNPGMPLGDWAKRELRDGSGNPLTDSWLAQQASQKSAHEQLIEFFGEDALLGGQYTPFDLEVFDRVTKDLGISYKPGGVIDSKALSDELLPRWTPDKPDGPSWISPKTGKKEGTSSLGPLAEYLGVDLGDGWHTADADAEASALVTERMLDRAVANPGTTPRTILDPDEMPNIVERRRKKYKADMEQYERDKIDYEAAVSGKMSVPQFETANGSTYERQADGKYKRRKDPVRSTTIDGPVEKIQKKTSAEDIAKDAASAEKLRTEQKRLESMSDGELDTLFSDGEYTYVVHFGAEEIAGGEMDPAKSVGAGDSFDADTRGINKTYSDAFIAQYNTDKATTEHVSSVVDTLKNGGQIDSPLSGTVSGTALNPYDSIYSGYYMKKGARRDRFSQDKNRPWPDADDLTEMGMTREELIDSLEKNTVSALEDRWRPKTETVKKLESNEGQFTSAFTVSGVVSGKDNPEAYGGRYSEGYDAATADRQDRIDSFAQNSRMGIHVLRVKMGEDATRLGFGNKTQREVHMLGKHKVVASMAAPTWGKRENLEGRDLYKGWMADVVKKDKAARAAEVVGKPADVVETTYDNTVFLTPDAKYSVQLAADRGRHLNSNGELMGLSYDDRNLNTPKLLKLRRDGTEFDEAFEKAGGVVSHYPISRSEIRESPQVGLHPFEWNTDGEKTHTGSLISAVTRRPGNDVDQTPAASFSVSGKMTLAQAETRKSIVDDKLTRYRKAVQEYDETGEWNGAKHGVVTALPSEGDAALHLDRVDIPPKNINFRDLAAENADKKNLTGADKEKFIADELKTRRADMNRKIQFLEREQKLAESLIESKRVRSEQNVLDIEDISPEEIEKLKAESAEIRKIQSGTTPAESERFQSLISNGDTRYLTHAGEPELKGGVLQGSSSIGSAGSYQGGTSRGSGDTRGLNNDMVVRIKGNVLSWEKSIPILDKAIKEAEDSGTFTYRDVDAEFAFRDVGDFFNKIRKSPFGTVFNIADETGLTKEQWIEKLKVQRNALAKDLEVEKNILSRIENDDFQFLTAEDAGRFARSGIAYFGRYSDRQIPQDIVRNVGDQTYVDSAGNYDSKKEIKDPEMAQRWIDSLRGTVWVTKGTQDVEWTTRLGPNGERQILGKTKPIVGFSSKKNDKRLLQEILPALLVRAINDDKNNGGTIRPLAVAGRVNASSGVSGKMSSSTMPIEELLADPATARELRERSSAVEALSDRERIVRFTNPNDPGAVYVIHFGASKLEGGQLDPARSRGQVGPNAGMAGNTRQANDQTARHWVGKRNDARRDVSILEEIKRQMETNGIVDFDAIERTDISDGMRVGRARLLLNINRGDPWRSTYTPPYWSPENFDAQIDDRKNVVSRLDKVADQLIADDYQYTSTYRASKLQDSIGNYGGRYAEGDSTEWGDNAKPSPNTGIHIFKVRIGDDAIEENSVGETHLVGKHTPIASLVVNSEMDNNPATKTWKGWVDSVIEQDIDKNNGKTVKPLGVSKKTFALTPEQITRRNESIVNGIKENGGSWGDFVPDSYRDGIDKIDAASRAAGGKFPVRKPVSKQEMKEQNTAFVSKTHESIQRQIRGEQPGSSSRLAGYEIEFLQHIDSMTPERFEQEVRDAAISFHAGIDPRPRVQVPHAELTTILEYGYKTTHEIRSDQSVKAIRMPYEASIGIHPNTPANLRPASGYIVHKDWLEAELKAAAELIETENLEGSSPELLQSTGKIKNMRDSRGQVEVYGGVEVILRPEVAERTKYLHGDSFRTKGTPTPMGSIDIDSVQYALFQSALFENAEPDDKITELLYGHWKKDHGASRRHMMQMSSPGFGAEQPIKIKENSPYMEALIAGSFDSGDIEEVVLDGMDNIPWEWLDTEEPAPGRKQEVTGGPKNPAFASAPQLTHLSDEKHLTEKMGFSPAEAKIAQEILRENLTIKNGKPGIFKTEQKFLALISLKNKLQSRDIKLTVKNDRGLDIFDPKNLNDLGAATAEEAVVMNVESRLRKMVRDRIAEAGKKAQEQASSLEKAVV